MVSKSLAVKYRPKRLEDLIGQEYVVAKLKGIIKTRNLPATILLAGGTGRGKTTVARMIARYLNCETFDACGKCPSCSYRIEDHPDFEELNVANERGIDDMRSLIRRSKNRPRVGRLRIYLLDEVHTLTPQASKTMLKPLEEPPEQTLWILATTDPDLLPATILGRAMVLHLKEVSRNDVSKRLKYIADKEGIEADQKLRLKIAELTGGYMRSAVQLLENVGAAAKGGLGTKDIVKMVEQDAQDSSEPGMDDAAIKCLTAMYGRSLTSMWRYTAPIKGEFVSFVNKILFLNQYLLEDGAHGDPRVVWHTALNRRFKAAVQSTLKDFKPAKQIVLLTDLHAALVRLRTDMVLSSKGSERGFVTARLGEWIIKHKG